VGFGWGGGGGLGFWGGFGWGGFGGGGFFSFFGCWCVWGFFCTCTNLFFARLGAFPVSPLRACKGTREQGTAIPHPHPPPPPPSVVTLVFSPFSHTPTSPRYSSFPSLFFRSASFLFPSPYRDHNCSLYVLLILLFVKTLRSSVGRVRCSNCLPGRRLALRVSI